MPSLIFDKCCGCVDLKTGSYIIAYLELILTSIYIILASVGLAKAQQLSDHFNIATTIIVALGIYIFFFTIFLIFVILLLVGLHKNKPRLLMAYLVYVIIHLILYVINFIAELVNSPTAESIVQSLLAIVISFYSILIIRSMHHYMKGTSMGVGYTA